MTLPEPSLLCQRKRFRPVGHWKAPAECWTNGRMMKTPQVGGGHEHFVGSEECDLGREMVILVDFANDMETRTLHRP